MNPCGPNPNPIPNPNPNPHPNPHPNPNPSLVATCKPESSIASLPRWAPPYVSVGTGPVLGGGGLGLDAGGAGLSLEGKG